MPDGSVRVPAHLTKPGVFTYRDAAGKPIREYRPPEEVAKADSLATYEDAHITIGHPPRGVSPATYARLNTGHVRASTVKADAAGVDAELVLRREDAIKGALDGSLHDLSCGYSVRIDATPGVAPDGQAYDRVQRDIVVNHVALLPRGDGRLGTDCALRLDSADEQVLSDEPSAEDKTKAEKAKGLKAKYGDSMKTKIRLDGKEVEVEAGCAEHIAFLEAEASAAKARADGADARLATFDAQAAQAKRAELVTQALAVGVACTRKDGEKEVALDARGIKVAVVQKRIDSSFTGKDASDAYLDGMFAAAIKADGKAAPSIAAGLNGGTQTAPTDVVKGLEKLVTDADDAWKVK